MNSVQSVSLNCYLIVELLAPKDSLWLLLLLEWFLMENLFGERKRTFLWTRHWRRPPPLKARQAVRLSGIGMVRQMSLQVEWFRLTNRSNSWSNLLFYQQNRTYQMSVGRPLDLFSDPERRCWRLSWNCFHRLRRPLAGPRYRWCGRIRIGHHRVCCQTSRTAN